MPSILLVDDRRENLLALEALLEPLAARIVTAQSGRAALAAVLNQDFALILLDVMMPDIDGFEVARHLRSRDRSSRIPIIFVTAASDASTHVFDGYGIGAVDYIIKPVDPFILLSKVSVFVELYARNAELRREAEIRSAYESLTLAQRAGESGIWDWDLPSGSVHLSAELRDLHGLPGEVEITRSRWLESVHPDDRPRIARRIEELIEAGEAWDEEFRVDHPDRGIRWLSARGKVRRDADGRPLRFTGISTDVTRRRNEHDAALESAQRFRAMADDAPMLIFTAADDGAWTYANRAWQQLTGMSADESLGYGWAAIVDRGERRSVVSRYRRACANGKRFETTFRISARDGRHRWLLTRTEPQTGPDGAVVGHLGSAVDITAQMEDDRRHALEAELGRLFDQKTGLAEQLDRVSAFFVEHIRAACVVELCEPTGEVFLRCGAGRSEQEAAAACEALHSSDAARAAVSEALSTGAPAPIPREGPSGRRHQAPSLTGPGVVTPLRSRRQTLGVIITRRNAHEQPFATSELELLGKLSHQAAFALENARLHERDRQIARELQSAMLPAVLPRSGRAAFGARYRPGISGLQVGGDWYDAFYSDDGRLVCCLGDVVGSGVRAASTMGQLRTATRALVISTRGPAALLRELDRFAETVEGGEMATIAYLELDDAGTLSYACAGHPPPLLLTDDGARFLEGGRSAPLASFGNVERSEATELLPPGASLLLYSDGLVERRGEAFDVGLERLMGEATKLDRTRPDLAASSLVERMLDGETQRDDACVLWLHRAGYFQTFKREVRADLRELYPLRQEVRAWLQSERLADDEANVVLIAINEACSNAIEHGQRDGRGSISLDVERRDDELSIAVVDRGIWGTPVADENRGRGLTIIRAVMDTVEIEKADGGTTVRMRRRLTS